MRRVSLRLAWLVTAAAAVVLDDTTIRDAVTAWLADATAAEATYGHISAWDTSQVTDMKQLFQNSIFNDDISAWDTSAVTNMFATFGSAEQFDQPLNDWNVSGVTSMVGMFAHAESFNQPLDSWDVSQVASLDSMFYYAYALDQDLGWCIDASVVINSDTLQGTSCVVPKCGIGQKDANGVCIFATRPPTPAPTPIQTSAAGAVAARYWTLAGALAGAAVLLL
jgi:hypothetical protein